MKYTVTDSSQLDAERCRVKELEAQAPVDGLSKEKEWKDMTGWEKTLRILINTLKTTFVFILLYFFICSLDLLSSAFRLVAGKSTGDVMNNEYTSNPVVGLMIGILVTVLVQSSSTSTSVIVSMVASGILDVHTAIPMIMGANIGTSVTNTIVSLTQVGDREVFRRAFSGATVHDMFNWLSVIVLLTLEVISGFMEKMTELTVQSINFGDGSDIKILKVITEPFTDMIIKLDKTILECWGMGAMKEYDSAVKKYCKYNRSVKVSSTLTTPLITTTSATSDAVTFEAINATSSRPVTGACLKDPYANGVNGSCHFLFHDTGLSDQTVGILLLLISLTVLCVALIFIVKILNSMLQGSIAKVIKKTVNSDIPYVPWLTGYIAILIGAVLTFIVQSSSIFTSTLTPLIGMGLISVDRCYPLTLGSNIGTTTTALLASMAGSGDSVRYAIQIALVHLYFNVSGILLFYPIPFMRWPLPLCKKLGDITARYRWFAIFYLIALFFCLPSVVFAVSLGGPVVFWSVMIPAIVLLLVVIAVNLLQNKKPGFLPKALRTWDFLPEALRSLEPYDRIMTGWPCCKKCNVPQDDQEIVIKVNSESNIVKEKFGIENAVFVPDTVSPVTNSVSV